MTKVRRLSKSSSKGAKSAKRSTPSSEHDLIRTVEGFKVRLQRALLSHRSQGILLEEPRIEAFPKESVLAVRDPTEQEYTPPTFPAAPVRGDDMEEEEYAAQLATWETQKATWEQEQASKPPTKLATVLMPVFRVVRAEFDGLPLRVVHTVRGPVIGAITSEDTLHISMYSPALVDPNLTRGRVHFIPVAFASYEYRLYKSSAMGESVPDEALALGYPSFVKRNMEGDYILQSKGAYHHVDADMPHGAQTVPVPHEGVQIRNALEGMLATSDGLQPKQVESVRALKRMQK